MRVPNGVPQSYHSQLNFCAIRNPEAYFQQLRIASNLNLVPIFH